MKRTLERYILSEILPPFLIGLLAFTVILLTARILRLVELVVTRGLPLLRIMKLLGLILPTFLELTLPMALLLGIFLGLTRLSNDQEILALKASGISPFYLLRPVGLLALLVSLITFLTAAWLRPHALLAVKKELYDIAKTHIASGLKERVFNDDFPNVLIYVEELVPPGNSSQGVLIVDRRNPAREMIIFAKVALILPDEESKTVSLKLLDGTVYERERNRPGFSQTHFNIYHFKLDLEEAFSPTQKKERGPREMSLRRLVKTIFLKREQGLQATDEIVEYHQRLSLALAPLVLSLLGLSFVLMPTRARATRSWGLSVCLFWFLAYYALLSLGKALAERQILPPAPALWLPTVVLGLMAAHFFRKAVKESPLRFLTQVESLSFAWLRRLAGFKQRAP
ncbi:MAG: LPS export ABC transporter permease LptF [Deltaproteobacteria bacterium]|nr:LPS export ABC transporter permease LptF [Deltaproteobacteria bacterium]